MTPLLLTRAVTSMKKEIMIVLGAMAIIMLLPIVALASLTNVGAIGDSGAKLYTGTASTTNTYIFGYCTFWAAQRREQIGKPIPNDWGDAHSWDDGARLAKYAVDHIPTLHAIMQSDAGELGHVAFVEKVNTDGSWEVSEMNVRGWDIMSPRTFKAADAKDYNFIH